MATTSFYKYMANSISGDMQEIESSAVQLKWQKSLNLVGRYHQEQFNGNDFFWLKDIFTLYFSHYKKSPRTAILALPKDILSELDLQSRLKSAVLSVDSDEAVKFKLIKNFTKYFIVKIYLPMNCDELKCEFPNFLREENNARKLSLPVKAILILEQNYCKNMTNEELSFLIKTGAITSGKGLCLYSERIIDSTSDYFIDVMNEINNEQ